MQAIHKQIAIIQFPGSNCERETMLAVKRAGMQPIEVLWNAPSQVLEQYDGYIIVGGFSYEDRSRAGIIAALDPLMQVIKQQSKLGKPVLGICNGAQILVETGLVPGLENDKLGLALTDNKRVQQGKVLGTGYYNDWVYLRLSPEYQLNAFTHKLSPAEIFHVPVAHAEGRFVIPPALLKEIQINGLNVFQYCDREGQIINEFPINPNGSIDNIAAISNKAGNVMAMMPHPERTPNGDGIFHSMREYLMHSHRLPPVSPLNYLPRPEKLKNYQSDIQAEQWIIELIITDNHAMSVQNALHQLNIPVQIKRQIHWEVVCDSPGTLEKIKASGVLYNDRKEALLTSPVSSTIQSSSQAASFLVRAKEDMVGQQAQQMLQDHFGLSGIKRIRHGVLWHILETRDELTTEVLNSHILFNPYAHECYFYDKQ